MDRTIIPQNTEISEEEKDLMIKINKLVGKLFEQEDHLKPSPALNGKYGYRLFEIKKDPFLNVSYSITQKECGYYGHIWLNFSFNVDIFDKKEKNWAFTWLTPKQTFWILQQLKDSTLLKRKIHEIALRQAQKLQESAKEIQSLIENDLQFCPNSRTNKIFDTAIEGVKKDYYTNHPLRANYFYDQASQYRSYIHALSSAQERNVLFEETTAKEVLSFFSCLFG